MSSEHAPHTGLRRGFLRLGGRGAGAHCGRFRANRALSCSGLDHRRYVGRPAERPRACALRAEGWAEMASVIWVLFFSGNAFSLYILSF